MRLPIRWGTDRSTRLACDTAGAAVHVAMSDGEWVRHAVGTLNNTEQKAVMVRHMGYDGRYSEISRLSDADRIALIRDYCETQLADADGDSSSWVSPWTTGAAPKGARVPAVEAPTEPVVEAPAEPAGSLDNVVGTIAARVAQNVVNAALDGWRGESATDADAVAAIVRDTTLGRDEIRALILESVEALRPIVTNVNVNGVKVGDVQGRTHSQFGNVLAMLTANVSPFLKGPAGTGKTFLARQVASAMGLDCIVVSCHPMISRSELFGFVSPGTNELNLGPVGRWVTYGGVLLFDEVDAAHPAALVTLNDVTAAKPGTLVILPDGSEVPKHADCHAIAAANTFGTGPDAQYVGRNALDAATLDRFATIEIDYDAEIERELVRPFLNGSSDRWLAAVAKMRRNIADAKVKVVVSTRGVADVARLVHAGLDIDFAVKSRIVKGLGADQTAKLLNGVSLVGIGA